MLELPFLNGAFFDDREANCEKHRYNDKVIYGHRNKQGLACLYFRACGPLMNDLVAKPLQRCALYKKGFVGLCWCCSRRR